MCLGIPGQILRVSGDSATIDCWGTEKQVRLDVLGETVLPGDYVITHSGCVVRRIPDDEIADTLALYETILAECELEEMNDVLV